MKWKLIGSSSTIEEMQKLLNNYFYSSITWLPQGNNNLWHIRNFDTILKGYRIIKRNNRYRFEKGDFL